MSKGLRVMQSFETAPIRKIGLKPQASAYDPLFVTLEGVGFRKAVSVRVNGAEIPGFTVVSDTSIVFEMPPELYFTVVERVDVLTETEAASTRVRVSFEMGAPKSVQGTLKLAQRVTKLLMTTPGSDIFHPADGGGMLSLLAQSIDKSSASGISAQFMVGVDRVGKRLIEDQAIKGIPADERLAQIHVLDLSFDSEKSTLRARLGIESMAGTVAVTGLEA